MPFYHDPYEKRAEFMEFLKNNREATGLSKRDFANLIGINPPTYFNWEKGNNFPRYKSQYTIEQVVEMVREKTKECLVSQRMEGGAD